MGLNMSQYVSIEIHVFIVCPEKTVTNLIPKNPNFHLFRDLHIDILGIYQPTKTSTCSFEGSDRSGSLSRCHPSISPRSALPVSMPPAPLVSTPERIQISGAIQVATSRHELRILQLLLQVGAHGQQLHMPLGTPRGMA